MARTPRIEYEATITVESPVGALLLEETRLVGEGNAADGADAADATNGELLSWTGHAYDTNRRKLFSRDATGIVAEYRYSPCCGKIEWERNAAGVETYYTRDADDRITARIVTAPGRPEVETHYGYGSFGQLVRNSQGQVISHSLLKVPVRSAGAGRS